MSALVKYDAARYALQQAVEIDEVKDIRDKAEAMAAYARQAKDTEMIQWVTEIKVRAERRAGQMLAEMPKAIGTKGQFAGGHTMVPPAKTAKTLSDLGITKNESSRWQKLAAVDEEKFEKAVSAAKEVAGEVTTAAMLRIARKENADATPPSKPNNGAVAVSELPKKEAAQEPETAPEDDYTETDELRDQVAGLQDMLAVRGAPDEERETTEKLVAGMREQINTLTATLNAVTASRDGLMRTNAQLMKQVAMQRKEIDKLRSMVAVA
jgi:hypothetical protein